MRDSTWYQVYNHNVNLGNYQRWQTAYAVARSSVLTNGGKADVYAVDRVGRFEGICRYVAKRDTGNTPYAARVV